jgi:micrococcal nuclease
MIKWKWLTAILFIVCVAQALYIGTRYRTPEPPLVQGIRVLSVMDGDTFAIDGRAWSPFPDLKWKIRIAGIDTPEMKGHCPAERVAARQAKTLLTQYLRQHGNIVTLSHVHHDKYGGRFVATVNTPDGEASQVLLDKNLARPYTGQGHKPDWCGILR